MAIFLLIAIGLANPTIRNLSHFWGGSQTSTVIILDNSASMGTIDGTSQRIEAALDSAEKILDQLGTGDNVGVIVTCGPSFPENAQLFSNQEKVRKILRDVKVFPEKAHLSVAVQQARTLLVKSKTPSKLIFVISDQQRDSWHGLQVAKNDATTTSAKNTPDKNDTDTNTLNTETDSVLVETATIPNPSHSDEDVSHDLSMADQKAMLSIPIILVNCKHTPKPNVGLIRLDTKNVLPIAQVPVSMSVFLKNESSIEQKRRLDVFVNGAKQYSSEEISVEPNGQTGHPFTVTFDRGGLHKGEIRLAGFDGNAQDDKFFFAMEVDQGVPVLIVKSSRHEIPFMEDSYYVEKALQTGAGGVSPVQLTTILKDDLLTEPLQNYAAIIAVNLPAPSQDAALRLIQYVERGGNLIWTCGENVHADEYNSLNAELENKLIPAPLLQVESPSADSGKDAWNIDSLDGSYPAFRNLVSPREIFSRVLVTRRIPIDVSKETVPTLASLDDGMPLIVQRRIGNGTITMFTTTINNAWTNFPVRPIFVPLINQLVFQLAGVEQTRLQTVAGMPITFNFKDDDRPNSVEVIPPSGAVLTRELKKDANGQSTTQFVFEETDQIGVYLLRPLGSSRQIQIPFSVNLDGTEVDATTLTEEECPAQFGGTPFVFTQVGNGFDETFSKLKKGTGLWDAFLWTVLVVLVCEAFVSNQLSTRKEDQEKGINVRHLLPRKTPSLGG
ncbi:MAG: VWA domain-containing protein [Thermoguttaceae bacterium]